MDGLVNMGTCRRPAVNASVHQCRQCLLSSPRHPGKVRHLSTEEPAEEDGLPSSLRFVAGETDVSP